MAKKDTSLLSYYGFTKADQKKYPVISGILKQLTPERIKAENKKIQAVKLPPDLQKWVDEYNKVGSRDEFIWKWIYKLCCIITFPIIDKKYQRSLRDTKFLLSMLIILIDDAIDEKKEESLYKELFKIPFEPNHIDDFNFNKQDREYIEFSITVWNYIEKSIKSYPKFKDFEVIFNYDILQVLNSLRYSEVINKNPYLTNETDYWLYSCNSMQAMVYFVIDLMCSNNFNIKEFGPLRENIWLAQKMTRVGNWISTWEREIQKGDITSGIFIYAVKFSLLSIEDLKKIKKQNIIRNLKQNKIEKEILKIWEENYFKIRQNEENIKAINIRTFLSNLEKLIILDLVNKTN